MTFFPSSIQEKENSFWNYYRNKKILIAGFSLLTGYSLAKLFDKKKISYSIYDQNINLKLKKKIQSKKNYCLKFFDKISKKVVEEFEEILLSPGIPRKQNFIQHAISKKIKIWNDFDFLYPLYKDKIIIAVTGTDGKTTVVEWLNFFFQNNNKKTYLCGNVGIPIASDYKKLLASEVIILELSSYMLEDIKQFRANCSVITNVHEDHLNRYDSFQEYANTKINLLKNTISSDFFLWNIDDKLLYKINTQKFNCQFLSFSLKNKKADFYYQNGIYYCNKKIEKKIQLKNSLLHDSNFLIVFIISLLYQKKINFNLSLLKKFVGVEHRLEKVIEQIYNDSKATTVQAIHFAITSLNKNFKSKKINLILGGRNKNLDFTTLKKFCLIIDKIYIYGESRNEILLQIKSFFNCQVKEKFDDCVDLAFKELTKKNILLLSPGCASQDQFQNYQQRGIRFKQRAMSFLKNMFLIFIFNC